MEVVKSSKERDGIPNMDLLLKYLPKPEVSSLLQPHNADMLRIWDARPFGLEVDKYFKE